MKPDYYKVLGVPSTASDAEIKSAYRRKARELHPDVNPSAEATRQFQELNAAYQILSDRVKRSVYDRMPASGTPRPNAYPPPPPRPAYSPPASPPPRPFGASQPPYQRPVSQSGPTRAAARSVAGQVRAQPDLSTRIFLGVIGLIVVAVGMLMQAYGLVAFFVVVTSVVVLNRLRILSGVVTRWIYAAIAVVLGITMSIAVDVELGPNMSLEAIFSVLGYFAGMIAALVLLFVAYRGYLFETIRPGVPARNYRFQMTVLTMIYILGPLMLIYVGIQWSHPGEGFLGLLWGLSNIGVAVFTGDYRRAVDYFSKQGWYGERI